MIRRAEQGFALLLALFLMVVVSLIAIGISQNTALQSRIAASQQGREVAFQMAEMALQVAEQKILNREFGNNEIYAPGSGNTPQWARNLRAAADCSHSRIHCPDFSDLLSDVVVVNPPQYFVEDLGKMYLSLKGASLSLGRGEEDPGLRGHYYRVHSRGFGLNDEVVLLESIVVFH